MSTKNKNDLSPIVKLIERLTGENGCPWDINQTPKTLEDYLLEECFELVDAIRKDKWQDVQEEIGDIFFLLIFVAHLYQKKSALTIEDIIHNVEAKMIRRHPHVFDNLEISSKNELLQNWEKIKREENIGTDKKYIFDSLPPNLPPLLRAYRLNSKSARFGFTWDTDIKQFEHLQLKWQEWLKAEKNDNKDQMEEEFGDYLFSLVEYGRRHGIKANAALNRANLKYLERIKIMENLAENNNSNLQDSDVTVLNQLWEKAKTILKQTKN